MTIAVTRTPGGVRVELRVIPRSPRAGVGGTRDGRLLVRVTAPPVDQAANAAVEAAMADAFGIPKRRVAIVRGQTSRNKTVELSGLSEEAVRAALATIASAE